MGDRNEELTTTVLRSYVSGKWTIRPTTGGRCSTR